MHSYRERKKGREGGGGGEREIPVHLQQEWQEDLQMN